jgi:pimeloyl-ACP methyl ester carboxylesterase
MRLPPTASASSPAPVLLFICDLDAYRTDHTTRTTKQVQNGWACISVEIPGTGDSPAAPNDPLSPDRQWSSVLDWIAGQDYLDKSRVVARGVSTGGYYAMRIAHTHAERLHGVVAQGGGCHGMFDPVWIEAQDGMEYPFG